jgi:adenosine deaminase
VQFSKQHDNIVTGFLFFFCSHIVQNNEAKGMTKRSYMDAVIKGLKEVEAVDVALFDSNFRTNETLNSKLLDGDAKKKKIYVRLLLSIDRRETASAALDTVC